MAKVKRIKVAVGQVAAVPLPSLGGYGRVVVVRVETPCRRSDPGVLLYGYGPRIEDLEHASRVDDLDPETVVEISDTGSILISSGDWPVVGQLPAERVLAWPFPRFITYHSTFGEWQEIPYSEELVGQRYDLERRYIEEDPESRCPILDPHDPRPIAQYGVSSAYGVGGHLEYALINGFRGRPPFGHPSWGRWRREREG